MQPRDGRSVGCSGVAELLTGTVAAAALATPAAAQQEPSEQAVRDAVQAVAPDPMLVLGVAAVGGFAGALLANAVWNLRGDSGRDSQPGAQAGGMPPGPAAGTGGRVRSPGEQPQQSGQGARQGQPLAQEPGGQQGDGPLGESAQDRDQQR